MVKSKDIRRAIKKDLPMVDRWYKARGIVPMDRRDYPTNGFIVDERVAGWIHLCDGNLAVIEGIIANPESVPSLRRSSLVKLCAFMTDFALSLGYTNVIGLSRHPAIEKVGMQLGYKVADYKLLLMREEY